jgi:hypothetical protein
MFNNFITFLKKLCNFLFKVLNVLYTIYTVFFPSKNRKKFNIKKMNKLKFTNRKEYLKQRYAYIQYIVATDRIIPRNPKVPYFIIEYVYKLPVFGNLVLTIKLLLVSYALLDIIILGFLNFPCIGVSIKYLSNFYYIIILCLVINVTYFLYTRFLLQFKFFQKFEYDPRAHYLVFSLIESQLLALYYSLFCKHARDGLFVNILKTREVDTLLTSKNKSFISSEDLARIEKEINSNDIVSAVSFVNHRAYLLVLLLCFLVIVFSYKNMDVITFYTLKCKYFKKSIPTRLKNFNPKGDYFFLQLHSAYIITAVVLLLL